MTWPRHHLSLSGGENNEDKAMTRHELQPRPQPINDIYCFSFNWIGNYKTIAQNMENLCFNLRYVMCVVLVLNAWYKGRDWVLEKSFISVLSVPTIIRLMVIITSWPGHVQLLSSAGTRTLGYFIRQFLES